MGIAGTRASILETQDTEWLTLHFFCLWGVVASSIHYSARFNNADAFHRIMWALFLLGLAGQISFLDHSLPGFAGATAFLYALVAAAFLRVALLSQRSRKFCLYWAASNLSACCPLLLLALCPETMAPYEVLRTQASSPILAGDTLLCSYVRALPCSAGSCGATPCGNR